MGSVVGVSVGSGDDVCVGSVVGVSVGSGDDVCVGSVVGVFVGSTVGVVIGSAIDGLVVDVSKVSSVLSVGDVVVLQLKDDRINKNIGRKRIRIFFLIIPVLN